jgi:hypothetical protein
MKKVQKTQENSSLSSRIGCLSASFLSSKLFGCENEVLKVILAEQIRFVPRIVSRIMHTGRLIQKNMT